jgi:phosphoribosylaminoimidazolecarboxamide formyltransferase/IMP cyclohydrolase
VCVIVKHGNPCGAAWMSDPIEAFETAKAADPVSAFGGIVAIPGRLSAELAERIAAKGNFFEIIACQSAGPDVVRLFEARTGWGQNVRIIECPLPPEQAYLDLRTVRGAALAQSSDATDSETWTEPTSRKLEPDEVVALKAAWICAKHVKSNAIVVCDRNGLIGVGAGQMNRVKSVRLALEQAGGRARGAVLASDAFFPFADSIEEAAKWGIAAVVQPGGSKKDEEVIQAAERLGIKIALTGTRHFRH